MDYLVCVIVCLEALEVRGTEEEEERQILQDAVAIADARGCVRHEGLCPEC